MIISYLDRNPNMNGSATVVIKANNLPSIQDALAEVKSIIGYAENIGGGWNSNKTDSNTWNSSSNETPAGPPPTAEPEYVQIDWQAAAKESVSISTNILSICININSMEKNSFRTYRKLRRPKNGPNCHRY